MTSLKSVAKMADAELSFEHPGHGAGAGGVAFVKHADGVCLVSCGADGQVAVRDAATAAVRKSHAAGGPDSVSPLLCLAASPSGGQVATGGKDQLIKASEAFGPHGCSAVTC